MADILIKGMEMPLRCLNCPFETYYHAASRCLANRGKKIVWEIGNDRGRDCPLVLLPAGHGDLIEKSEAYDKIAEQEGGNYIDMDSVGLGLEECQTIVPAEGGDEDG